MRTRFDSELMSQPSPPDANTTMKQLLADYPSARRALFAAYHIGGCQSCAFDEENTLAAVCEQHELNPEEVCRTIAASHQEEQNLLVSPSRLKEKLASSQPPTLIDTRTKEEHESVKIDESIFLTENTLASLSSENSEQEIIIYDHTGKSVLDHVSWFRGHGLKQTFALAGGIDAYAKEADSSIPRYRLEMD